MFEISRELDKRDGAICCECGAIFEEVPGIEVPCLECGKSKLNWITDTHDWIELAHAIGRRKTNG